MRKQNPEYDIQASFVKQMGIKLPQIMVFSDTSAHIKKTRLQQIRANKLSSGVKWPDVFIPQPSGEYAGLYLEFKAETPFKKDGVTLKKDDHVEAQAQCLEMLRHRGYMAEFVWSAEQAFNLVKKYLDL